MGLVLAVFRPNADICPPSVAGVMVLLPKTDRNLEMGQTSGLVIWPNFGASKTDRIWVEYGSNLTQYLIEIGPIFDAAKMDRIWAESAVSAGGGRCR